MVDRNNQNYIEDRVRRQKRNEAIATIAGWISGLIITIYLCNKFFPV